MGVMKSQNVSRMLAGGGSNKSGFRVTKFFFDSAAVMRSVDAASRRVLSKFGAYVRTAARSSIRSRKKMSAPGQPPSSHAGLLKRFLFFSYDPRTAGVVIGPERLNATIGDAPHALEYGGPSRVTSAGRASRGRKKTVVRTANIRPRPYMRPALAKELPKLPAMWAGSVKP